MGPNTLRIVLVGIADKKDDASSSTNEMYLDCEAFLAIHRTISPKVFKSISTCKSAHEGWTKLEDIYGGSNLDEDGIMMKELVHELFTLFDLKESTTTSISDCLHTSASSISQAKSEQLEHELEKSHQACRDLRSSKGEIEVAHDKLKRDFEVLLLECKNVKGELVKTSKIFEELQSTHEKSLIATYSSHIVDDTCTSNPISFEASTLKENVELRAQLDLLTSNYGKLEENHVMLTSSHADLLTSHNVQKLAHEAIITKVTSSEPHVDNGTTSRQSTIFLCASPRNSSTHNIATSCDELLSLPCCSNIEAYTSSSPCIDTNCAEEIKELKAQVTSLKKDLEQCHEGMPTLNNVLSEQTSPNDKNDVGVNSNKNKRGLEQVKNSAKIICFKCKVKGHHFRSCPLKTKSQSHKQQGKRPQTQSHIQLQVEGRPLPNKTQANTPRGTTGDALDARLTYKEYVETM
ncbi:hypothetical protein D1007_60458 [Hordeum vulgare]|nr:hypothetical protein D1007_60458 [Hordeum vulgare]